MTDQTIDPTKKPSGDAAVPEMRSRGDGGFTCAAAPTAATSDAVTIPRASTRPRTRGNPVIRSLQALSQAKTGSTTTGPMTLFRANHLHHRHITRSSKLFQDRAAASRLIGRCDSTSSRGVGLVPDNWCWTETTGETSSVPDSRVHGGSAFLPRNFARATSPTMTRAMARGTTICTWRTSRAPSSAPTNMAATARRRRPDLEPVPPPMTLSAPIPVTVIVNTVVVKSGTANFRILAFWTPVARLRTTMSAYRKKCCGAVELQSARTTDAAKKMASAAVAVAR